MTPQQSSYDSRMKAFLAVFIVTGFFAVVAGLFFVHEIEGSVKDVLLVMLGALLSSFKEVVGFFYGSSSGSAAKGATIERALEAATPLAGDAPVEVKIDTSEKPVAVQEQHVESSGSKGDANGTNRI